MKRSVLLFAVWAVLSSCVVSQRPFLEPTEATPDQRLWGLWKANKKNGETIILRFEKSDKKNAMKLVMIERKKDGEPKVEGTQDLFVYPEYGLINLNARDPNQKKENKEPKYVLVKYSVIDADTVAVWAVLDKEVIANDIENGKLKGSVDKNRKSKLYSSISTVFITEPTRTLAKYSIANRNRIFKKNKYLFRRSK